MVHYIIYLLQFTPYYHRYDLHNKYKWEKFILRLGQFLVFDLHDAGSGLLFAKARLSYETIINKYIYTNTDIVSVFIEFTIANEYGGGKLGGVVRMHIDISVNTFVRSKKSVEYWDTHRVEHWTAYPIVPISTGKFAMFVVYYGRSYLNVCIVSVHYTVTVSVLHKCVCLRQVEDTHTVMCVYYHSRIKLTQLYFYFTIYNLFHNL